GIVAVDPVAAPALLVRLEVETIAVDPLAQTGNGHALRPRRDVDVQDRPAGQPVGGDSLDQGGQEGGGRGEVVRLVAPEIGGGGGAALGDGDPGDAEQDALERGRHGSRVGDVIAQIEAVVDPRHDQ